MSSDVFRKGDRVYNHVFGWGKVLRVFNMTCSVEFDDGKTRAIHNKRLSFKEYDLVNGGFTHERPFELEEGKDYVSEDGDCLILDFKRNDYNYGFIGEMWRSGIIINEGVGRWSKAYVDVVKNMLEGEAVRRFGGDWAYVRIKECMVWGRDYKYLNKGVLSEEVSKRLNGWEIWSRNGCIFYGGKWAEPLVLNNLKPFQKVLVRDFDNTKWRIDLFSNTSDEYGFECMSDYWDQCVPFEGNEYLLGTKNNPE